MTFRRGEPGFHYRALRLISSKGLWELGLSPFSHGMRCRMGRAGRPPSILDFCMGRNETLFWPILSAVLDRIEPLPEMTTPQEIDAAFPWAGTRPDLTLHLNALLRRVDLRNWANPEWAWRSSLPRPDSERRCPGAGISPSCESQSATTRKDRAQTRGVP